MPTHQYSLDLITHQVDQSFIQQRARDGYINATQLCTAAKKPWHRYEMQEDNGRYIRALAERLGITRGELIQTVAPSGEIWVHPQVAIHLGQWLSVDFQLQVSAWVHKWMSGELKARPEMPPHVERYMLNYGKVPSTHFSILQQMMTSLIAPLQSVGYVLPDRMLPDVSQGQMFCKYLRTELKLDTAALPTYEHEFPDGRVVDAKLYPIEYLGVFCKYVNEVWIPQRAKDYFQQRDPDALPYLDKMLSIAYDKPKPSPVRSAVRWNRPRGNAGSAPPALPRASTGTIGGRGIR